MQIRVLVWLNLALALGVVVWAWFFLPFAHGVACGLGQQCPPLSLGQRGLQSALPGFLIAAVALTGRHLASRFPTLSRAVLLVVPAGILVLLALGLARSLA